MSGYLLQQAQASDALAGRGCTNCPHLAVDHLELSPGAPGYRPLHFHCRAEACGCVIVPPVRAKDVQVAKYFRAGCYRCEWTGAEHATYQAANTERLAHLNWHTLGEATS